MDKYRVVFSGLLKQEVVKLGEKAKAEGRLMEAKAVFTALMNCLQTEPKSFGELLYHSRQVGWPVFHFVRSPWSIHFIVNNDRRLVFLNRIVLMD